MLGGEDSSKLQEVASGLSLRVRFSQILGYLGLVHSKSSVWFWVDTLLFGYLCSNGVRRYVALGLLKGRPAAVRR